MNYFWNLETGKTFPPEAVNMKIVSLNCYTSHIQKGWQIYIKRQHQVQILQLSPEYTGGTLLMFLVDLHPHA